MSSRSVRLALPLTLVLATLLALSSLALGGEARVGRAALHSTPYATATYGPGVVSGRAQLVSDPGTGTTSVVVRLEGLRPGSVHIGHIHYGDAAQPCARLQPGAIIHDLGPITANAHGVAKGRTVLEGSTAGIADCEWWVAFHEGPANASPQTPAIAIGPVRFVEPGE